MKRIIALLVALMPMAVSASNIVPPNVKPSTASTDNGVVRFDGTTGTAIQNSLNVVIDDFGSVGIGTTTPADQLEITGNLRLPTTSLTAGQIKQGATPVFHSFGTENTFLGESAGNFTLTGSGGVAIGAHALEALTGGNNNTAVGAFSLSGVLGGGPAGQGNSALGSAAGLTTTTGNNNVFLGSSADASSGTISNAVAIGANTIVAQSDSIILGDPGSTAIKVGIGTAAPVEQLEITGNFQFPATSSTVGQIKQSGTTFAHSGGTRNTFLGSGAGDPAYTNQNDNVGIGYNSLTALTAGVTHRRNVAVGSTALPSITTGSNNIGIGYQSGATMVTNTGMTLIGASTDADDGLSNATAIGFGATVSQSDSLVLGDGSIDVGIGTTQPAARLEVVGAADVIQTQIRANATQTANIFNVESSAAADILTVTGANAVVITDSGGNGGNVPHNVRTDTNTVAASSSCTMSCNAGETLTGGGCSNTLGLILFNSFPTSATPPVEWNCEYTLATGDCTAHVICAEY